MQDIASAIQIGAKAYLQDNINHWNCWYCCFNNC